MQPCKSCILRSNVNLNRRFRTCRDQYMQSILQASSGKGLVLLHSIFNLIQRLKSL